MMMKPHDKNQITASDLPGEFREIAQEIGLAPALKLLRRYSGAQIYVPKYETIIRPIRNRAIKAEFDGSNYKALSCKYGISTSHLRAILKKQGQ